MNCITIIEFRFFITALMAVAWICGFAVGKLYGKKKAEEIIRR